jgi:hypothetical protein
MIGDHYNEKWRQPNYDWLKPYIVNTSNTTFNASALVSRREFEELKNEVIELKKLLERAIDYDKRNNEPNCEIEEKVALLKKVAELVGISLEDIFPKQ